MRYVDAAADLLNPLFFILPGVGPFVVLFAVGGVATGALLIWWHRRHG